jgi:hypothetical protein
MRKVGLMVAAASLVAASAIFAHAPNGETHNVVKFPAGRAPTIDADCSDWGAVPGDQYWILTDELYPLGDRHPTAGMARGENDASSFATTYRLGWSSDTNNLYYCNTVFDDVHTIDRPGDFDWYEDDSNEYFFNIRHLSTEEVAALSGENFSTYLGFNYSVPVSAAGPLWMINGICVGCEWIESDTELHTLAWSFTGEEFGESTYTYEQRVAAYDGRPTDVDGAPEVLVYQTLADNQVVHITLVTNDDDGDREDGRGGQWSTDDGCACAPYGDFLLEPLNPGIDWGATPTAVENQSWGRIKAQY